MTPLRTPRVAHVRSDDEPCIREKPSLETNYKFDLDLPESDVRALLNGTVPERVLEIIRPMVAWDDEMHPIARAYGKNSA